MKNFIKDFSKKNSKTNYKIGFLGPAGTFTEEAAALVGDNLIGFNSILKVLDAVENNNVDIGVVPMKIPLKDLLVLL